MMKKLLGIVVLAFCTLAIAAPSLAQHSRGGATARGSAGVRGGGSVVVSPRVAVSPGYRGYYYPRYSFGLYVGDPYFYSPYYYPYGYYGSYYGSPYGYASPYGYGGGYYVGDNRARGYGGLQIKDGPPEAQVFADGYYTGNVDDFDGAFQRLDLDAGPHHIEIREQGRPPVSFDVNIRPGENITYHAR